MSLEDVRTYINSVRRDFASKALDESSLKTDPFDQFASWMEEAVDSQILDPYAMCVSTVGAGGKPSSRIVYLRDVAEGGFVFYTNYQSHKGTDIGSESSVALNWHWTELERQIRVEGTAVKASTELSDAYWAARPRESQISACLSEQSKEVESRAALEARKADIITQFEGQDIPRPTNWGGYTVIPQRVEFWQGRPSRLHDRLVFVKEDDNWNVVRLNP
ncbi:MAG: pyridoxamine 5'-phosphate oxidase [Granulosicoccus sp.]|jgi:pyridoxamine 5'-phosphate oxidase